MSYLTVFKAAYSGLILAVLRRFRVQNSEFSRGSSARRLGCFHSGTRSVRLWVVLEEPVRVLSILWRRRGKLSAKCSDFFGVWNQWFGGRGRESGVDIAEETRRGRAGGRANRRKTASGEGEIEPGWGQLLCKMALIGLEMGQFSMQNACEIEWKPCFFVVKRVDFAGFQFGGGIEGKACAAWGLAPICCESEAGLILGKPGRPCSILRGPFYMIDPHHFQRSIPRL